MLKGANHDRPKDSRFRSKLDMKPARPSSTKLQTLVLAPLFLALSLVAGRASDDRGFAVLGFGNKSCGTYVEARSERYGDSAYRATGEEFEIQKIASAAYFAAAVGKDPVSRAKQAN